MVKEICEVEVGFREAMTNYEKTAKNYEEEKEYFKEVDNKKYTELKQDC